MVFLDVLIAGNPKTQACPPYPTRPSTTTSTPCSRPTWPKVWPSSLAAIAFAWRPQGRVLLRLPVRAKPIQISVVSKQKTRATEPLSIRLPLSYVALAYCIFFVLFFVPLCVVTVPFTVPILRGLLWILVGVHWGRCFWHLEKSVIP